MRNIRYISFWKGEPHELETDEGAYAVAYSRALGHWLMCYHGGGSINKDNVLTYVDGDAYWTAPDVRCTPTATQWRHEGATRLEVLPAAFRAWATWDGVVAEAWEVEMLLYCDLCDDYYPDDQSCEHIWWCSECGQNSAPGDRCAHVPDEEPGTAKTVWRDRRGHWDVTVVPYDKFAHEPGLGPWYFELYGPGHVLVMHSKPYARRGNSVRAGLRALARHAGEAGDTEEVAS